LNVLRYELIAACVISMITGYILFAWNHIWRKPIRTNLLHVIKFALIENDYAKEINAIQQQFQCCGVSLNGAEPQHIQGSLPWSCCRSKHNSISCEHLDFRRFKRVLNETNFERLRSYAAQFKQHWDCKRKKALALHSVYSDDCAKAFHRTFKFEFFYLNAAMSYAVGK
uniref:Tetraspanin n=1 Tax=Gongylonema pulchrum TaxID=637853 RepID=A0A183EKW1_9BILA